jgi:hypothetical protein
MPANRKPRKAYRPKPVVKPLGMKALDKLELPGRLAIAGLGADWLSIHQVYDIGAHAMLAAQLSEDEPEIRKAARAIMAVVKSMQDREERTGKMGATGDEMATLRAMTAVTMPWVTAQPNTAIHAASTRLLAAFDRQRQGA